MPFSFAAILNYKLGSARLVRDVAMEGKRFTGKELFNEGVIDQLAEDGAAVLKAARAMAAEKAPLAKTGVFGLMKASSSVLHRS